MSFNDMKCFTDFLPFERYNIQSVFYVLLLLKMSTEDNILQLRKAKEKRARYSSHQKFLDKCINNSRIQTGFHWDWKAELDMDEDLQAKCDNIKNNVSIKLMEI